MERLCIWIAFALLASTHAPQSLASSYPAKPVRIIVTLGAGGPADGAARAVAAALSRLLSQPVLVENRPGADGMVGAESVRTAQPDGYTLLWGQATNLTAVAATRSRPPYDPEKDFTPISLVGRFAICLFMHPDVPVATAAELAEHARAHPGKLTYATNSITEAVIAAQMAKLAGISMVRVPYKGGTTSVPDLLAGRVHLAFLPASTGMPHARAGKLRVLATLLPLRSPALPDVPTLLEAGFPGATMTPWFGLFGPANLPAAIVDRLARETATALALPDVQAQLQKFAVEPERSSPQALAGFLKRDIETWRQVIHEARITLE